MTDTAACCNAAGKTRQMPEGLKLEGGSAEGGEIHRPTATTWDPLSAFEDHSQDAALTQHIQNPASRAYLNITLFDRFDLTVLKDSCLIYCF